MNTATIIATAAERDRTRRLASKAGTPRTPLAVMESAQAQTALDDALAAAAAVRPRQPVPAGSRLKPGHALPGAA